MLWWTGLGQYHLQVRRFWKLNVLKTGRFRGFETGLFVDVLILFYFTYVLVECTKMT
jgi:hypothetical protein